jgi:hypothetical protein
MIEQGLCNSYKLEALQGLHQINDQYKLALYTEKASLNKDTVRYTKDEEVSGLGYTAGGIVLTGMQVWVEGDIAFIKWNSPTIKKATITARGGLIYNASRNNCSVVVLDFGENVSSTRDLYKVEFPTALIGWH